jgi:hypothetical protein
MALNRRPAAQVRPFELRRRRVEEHRPDSRKALPALRISWLDHGSSLAAASAMSASGSSAIGLNSGWNQV